MVPTNDHCHRNTPNGWPNGVAMTALALNHLIGISRTHPHFALTSLCFVRPGQLSGNTRNRLHTIISYPCPAQTRDDAMMVSTILMRWLQRIQVRSSLDAGEPIQKWPQLNHSLHLIWSNDSICVDRLPMVGHWPIMAIVCCCRR